MTAFTALTSGFRLSKSFTDSLFSLILPLVIFNITKDPFWAGVAVFLEFFSRIVGNLTLAKVLNILSERTYLLILSFLKTMAYLASTLFLFDFFTWHVLLLSCIFSQLYGSVLSNLYEINAKKWAGCSVKGYTSYLKIDNISMFLSYFVALLIGSNLFLMIICLLSSLISTFFIYSKGSLVFSVSCVEGSLKLNLRDFSKPFLKNSSLEFLLTLPVAVLFCAYPFFIEKALNLGTISVREYCFILILKSLFTIVILHFFSKYQSYNLKVPLFIANGFCGIFILVSSGYLFIFSTFVFGTIVFCLYPYIVKERQELINNQNRHSLTAVAAIVRSTSFATGGILISISTELSFLFSVVFLVCFLLSLFFIKIKSYTT